ncbi:MAG: TonB-dependent receptor [Chitinophagaceae bacterium]|nr:TonB-dependent receptor [Chitinophagaceae bacterium]
MREIFTIILLITISVSTFGQEQNSGADSTDVLEEVIIKGYEFNRRLIEVPATISVISKAQFNRYNNISLLPALNTAPGVRMEERSPGSYRLNIRGSSLRSPFGVRNVKVYYNNIPYTDPGGNTFFNQLGFYNINSIEIIKGPGSSLYGAGTGGVILLSGNENKFQRGASLNYTTGSFETQSIHGNIKGGSEDLNHSINLMYQKSDGYRVQTKMERKVISWDGRAKVGEKGTLRAHFLQGDLYYQTPGALTLAEYTANPKAARPAAGPTPGAVEAKAAIFQKMYLAGLNYNLVWSSRWQNNTTLYGAYSRLVNPTTRNYERRTEPHFGSRTVIQYNGNVNRSELTWIGGAEAQQGFGTVKVYTNQQGDPGNLQSDDEIVTRQWSLFTQGTLETPGGWIFTGGVSFNLLNVQLQRLSNPASFQEKKYNNEFAPRVAVLKKLAPSVSVYASVARGYSPPTNAELLPSTGVISTELEAERGTNYEAGIRGSRLNGRLTFDVNAFYFRLNNTISQRRDQSGADFFVNAGKTNQKGLESFISYRLIGQYHPVFENVKIWLSHTWHDFHYSDFQKVTDDTVDLSGKRLPSIPRHFVSAGVDAVTNIGFYANVTYYYSDPIPLNDANTDYASSYNLATARIGFRKMLTKRYSFDLFGTADNIFDVKYSLGNDINAFGGRYYNAAPGRNFALGVSMRYVW